MASDDLDSKQIHEIGAVGFAKEAQVSVSFWPKKQSNNLFLTLNKQHQW